MNYTELKIEETASGKLSLFITENVSYETFPQVAKQFLKKVNGFKIVGGAAPDMKIWLVLVRWRPYFLVFDDFPWGMSLDPMPGSSDKIIRDVYSALTK